MLHECDLLTIARMSVKVIGVVIGFTTPGESYNEVSVGFIEIMDSLSDDWNFYISQIYGNKSHV